MNMAYLICVMCLYVLVPNFFLTLMNARNSLDKWCVTRLYIFSQLETKFFHIMRDLHRGLVHWLKSILLICGNQIDLSITLLFLILYFLSSELFYIIRDLHGGLVHWLKSILPTRGNQIDMFTIFKLVLLLLTSYSCFISIESVGRGSLGATYPGRNTHVRLYPMVYDIIIHYLVHNSYE